MITHRRRSIRRHFLSRFQRHRPPWIRVAAARAQSLFAIHQLTSVER